MHFSSFMHWSLWSLGLNDGQCLPHTVTDDYVVGATTDIEDAAAFYISQPEAEGDEPVLYISYLFHVPPHKASKAGEQMLSS